MRRVLTERNKGKLKAALTRYMDGVIAEEEYLNTYSALREDIRRVECYNGETLSCSKCRDYLQGLPIGTAFITYNICRMLFSFLGMGEEEIQRLGSFWMEDAVDLDSFYWNTIAEIVFLRKDR